MRYVLTIWFSILWMLSSGQALSDIDNRLRLLDNPRTFIKDTTGFSNLPKIDFFCDNENDHPWDNYHVVDLDGDGLNDVIYSGRCKPQGQTAIFLNKSGSLKKVFNYQGELVAVEKKSSSSVIHILRMAGRCDLYSEYIAVTIDSASDIITKNTISFGPETKVKLGSRVKREKVVGILRTTPEVKDMNRKDPCGKQIVKGNHLVRIQNFKEIIQLSRAGTWWLVLYPLNKERSLIGWMKMNE